MKRFTTSEQADEISVVIQPPIERKFFHLFVLGFCIICLYLAFNHAFSTDKIFIKLFLLVWSFIWIPFIIKIYKSYIYWQTGTEIIKIKEDTISLIEQFPFKKSVKIFNKYNISIARVENYIPEKNSLVALPPKTFLIENKVENENYSFGRNLQFEEITIIFNILSKANINLKNEIIPTETINFNKKLRPAYFKFYKKLNRLYFLLSLLPSFLYGHLLFKNDYYDYSILKSNGEITNAVSTFRESWDIDYYSYYFITNIGEKIEKSGKTVDKEHFDKYFKNLQIIYDPTNPTRYMEYPDYLNYSIPLKIIFYLILIPLILSAMSGSVFTFGHLFYQRVKNRTHNNTLLPAMLLALLTAFS